MLHILLTNDDGYQAPGIQALLEALAPRARVTLMAPDRNRSGSSHALSLNRPVHVRWHEPDRVASVEGTPVDCVYIGLSSLPDLQPHLVISGINHGSNLGDDTLYSGTVAAAREAYLSGVPALAVSLTGGAQHMNSAVHSVERWLEAMSTTLMSRPTAFCLNMNVPDRPWSEVGGFRLAPLGRRERSCSVLPANHPRRDHAYWIGLPGSPARTEGVYCDFTVVEAGWVALTPLQWDQTAPGDFEGWQSLEQCAFHQDDPL